MAQYLSQEILDIKEQDKLRFQFIKKCQRKKNIKNQLIFDNWSSYAFRDLKIDRKKRNKEGVFYTPEWIVLLMVKNTINHWIMVNEHKSLWNIKILEPSCGSGNFVEIIIRQLLIYFLKHTQKNKQQILKHISENILYTWDINPDSIKNTKQRIYEVYGITLKNCISLNTLYQKITFDIIIGNPPYGNILSKQDKSNLKDKYNNIALSFLHWGEKQLNKNGVVYFIVPHSFSRTGGGAKLWREQIYKNKSAFEIIDVGNPFFDITLEVIIVGLSKEKNQIIKTNSIRENNIGNKVSIENFYEKNDDFRMVLYWDEIYQNIKNKKYIYPFYGKRGQDIPKQFLLNKSEKNASHKWYILGKNITKNGLKHISNYDKYLPYQTQNKTYHGKQIAITQFGTNLKASFIDFSFCYPSGGIVLVEHETINKKEALNYLNNPFINYYLNKYILNNAKLTVHLDGKYLSQIPYLPIKDINKYSKLCMKND